MLSCSSGCCEAQRNHSRSHRSRYRLRERRRSRDHSPLSSDHSRSREKSWQPGRSRRYRADAVASRDRGDSGSRVEPAPVVATLQRLLRKSGFSRGSAVEMSGCVKTSTSRLYQAKWMLFCGWCRGRGVAPVTATVPMIVDFLVHLRRDRGLSVSAV